MTQVASSSAVCTGKPNFTRMSGKKADVYVEWEVEAAALLARFRLAAARRADDPEFVGLIDRLHGASPEVRRWWPRPGLRLVTFSPADEGLVLDRAGEDAQRGP